MADQGGIDVMRRRIERASRQAPPPRRAPAPPDTLTAPGGDDPPAPEEVSAPAPESAIASTPARSRRGPRATPVRLAAALPPVNLAIRVRKPLDDRLADVIHQLRRDGVRTSKVELIEMLLWEMPDDQLPALRERLRLFRDWAPRGSGGPIDPAASSS